MFGLVRTVERAARSGPQGDAHMIITKYHGPTDTKGSRISAKGHQGRVVVAWDYAVDERENARRAALAYAARHMPDTPIAFIGQMQGGSLVFVARNAVARAAREVALTVDDL